MKYEKLVVRACIKALAEEEGRLRAAVEVRLASAARMRDDLKKWGVAGTEAHEKLETSVGQCEASAAAMTREAEEIRLRAQAILNPQPQKKEKPEPKRYTLEDVIFTMEGELALAGKDLVLYQKALVYLRTFPPALSDARNNLQAIAWPSGLDNYAGACIRVLDCLIAGRPTPLKPDQS